MRESYKGAGPGPVGALSCRNELSTPWGSTGLAQAGLFTMEQVWNLPGPARPGYLPRLGRAGTFLGLLGFDVAVTMGLASLSTYGHHTLALVVVAEAAGVIVNAGMYVAGFRILTRAACPPGTCCPAR
jgi:hypothetical protein